MHPKHILIRKRKIIAFSAGHGPKNLFHITETEINLFCFKQKRSENDIQARGVQQVFTVQPVTGSIIQVPVFKNLFLPGYPVFQTGFAALTYVLLYYLTDSR